MQNQFFGGGLVLMLAGAVMALLRQVPDHLLKWIKGRFTVSVMIVDRDPLFEWARLWLDAHPYSKRTRNLMCSLHREADEEFSEFSKMLFAPSYGRHFFRHGRKLVWLDYNKDKPTNSGSEGIGKSQGPETMTITVLGTNQKILRELMAEIATFASREENRKARGYISTGGWWRRLYTYQSRKIETVDLPALDQERIVGAIERFLAARTAYSQRGIPYHLNLLFEGKPGTGKTSLASALCGHFGLHLHLLNIAGPGMNDQRLVELMMSLPRRSMLLMEDVDAVLPSDTQRPKRKGPPSNTEVVQGDGDDGSEGITLSGLLNCMDGITAPDGAVIVMTTNHPELIDERLLRPGRVDMRIAFESATREQIAKMCARLDPNRKLNGDVDWMVNQGFTTAQVQAEIMRANGIGL
jgi:hypothetical protein